MKAPLSHRPGPKSYAKSYSGPLKGEEEDPQDEPNLRTYWLMVVERKWFALAVFLTVVLGVVTYTFLITPVYQAVATVEILKHGAQIMRGADIVEMSVTSDADFNTQIGILESRTIVENVVKQLTPEELNQLTAPYDSKSANPVAIIRAGRIIAPQRTSLITSVVFRHPNPKIAARIANLIAKEFIVHSSKVRIDESLKAIDDLKDRADQQRRHVEELANAMASYRQRGNLVSLVQSKDIVTEKLKALNMHATETGAKLKDAEVRWNQVLERLKAGTDIAELSFIGSQVNVSQLVQQITAQKVAIANLRQTFKDKHPRMVEALRTLEESRSQLQLALDKAAASIKADYETALRSDAAARKSLEQQQAESLDMDKYAVTYDNMSREFHVNEQLLEAMMSRMRETSITSSIDTQNARIVDAADEPWFPASPNVRMNLAIGIVAGLGLAIGGAYLISLIADQVKTSFDVESLVGVPMIGAIPRTERMEQPDKAQIVSNGADPMIAEAFLSLYSNLRLLPASKDAKKILVTSTMPGEGKSFVATNLALTFAAQGFRTVVVDCDLRKPNIQDSFRLQASKGVISYCTRGVPVDEIIVRNVHPHLDVVTSGGRTRNSVQLFNSPEFETLLEELGKRYDKVILDTPPIGAVSDALNILHFADGAIFAIRYNHVMRRAARRCARRLGSSDTPIFGAVLNDMNTKTSSEYYVEYNNKLVKEYYNPPKEGAAVAGSSDS